MVLKLHNLEFAMKKDLVGASFYMKQIEKAENKDNISQKEVIDRG